MKINTPRADILGKPSRDCFKGKSPELLLPVKIEDGAERKPKKSVAGRILNLHRIRGGIYHRIDRMLERGIRHEDAPMMPLILPSKEAKEKYFDIIVSAQMDFLYLELYRQENHEKEVGEGIEQLYS